MQQEVMQQCKEACLDEQDAPGKIQTQRKNTEKVAATLGNLGGIQKHCLVQLGQMKLRCPPTSTNLWSQKHIGLPIFLCALVWDGDFPTLLIVEVWEFMSFSCLLFTMMIIHCSLNLACSFLRVCFLACWCFFLFGFLFTCSPLPTPQHPPC